MWLLLLTMAASAGPLPLSAFRSRPSAVAFVTLKIDWVRCSSSALLAA